MSNEPNLLAVYEALGEVKVVAREAKHAANNASGKIDTLAGKVDALALAVATQAELRRGIEAVQETCKGHHDRLTSLEAERARREGALGLANALRVWIPVLVALIVVVLVVLKANGKI